MLLLYSFFIRCFYAGLSIAALWNRKAAQWKKGRENLWAELEQTFSKPHAVIWIHSASAGEFEQAKPVIEALKQAHPHYKILVTFFSPSGYPAGKKFALADYVFYLPLDTKKNAQRFVGIVQPSLVVFVKYDYWYHHLKAVRENGIPLLLVSALFRENQVFFKSYGGFFRNMLRFFTHLFVQDQTSYSLLKKAGITNVSIAGDTRFDRVLSIAEKFQPVPFLSEFVQEKKTIVAGSTWPDDEKMLYVILEKLGGIKLVLAPHEVDEAHIKNITQLFQNPILYSSLKEAKDVHDKLALADVLVIDNVGMLSRLYYYATIAYIGGGFNKSGIHNTLEAAVFEKPVLFGPRYQKFREARDLIACSAAFSYATEADLANAVEMVLGEETVLQKSSTAAADYVRENSGATQKILAYIQENRLLTN